MERLKNMKETLVGCVQAQLADIKNADTHELGEAIDMIKDLEESMYYCSIVKSMEEAEKEERLCPNCRRKAYMEYPYERDMDRDMGRMYYTGQPRNSRGQYMGGKRGYEDAQTRYDGEHRGGNSNMNYYHEREFPIEMRDSREGRSPMSRRMYMESKEMHKDKNQKVKELEKYMQELSEDIVEMIEGASPEEKQMLERKMTHLTSKIAQLNNG